MTRCWREGLERLRGAYADSTLLVCAIQFGVFERWCAQTGRVAAPPDPADVADFVAWSFQRVGASTVRNRLFAIRHICMALEVPDATRTEAVRLALRRGRRAFGKPHRQAAPLNAALRDRMRQACPRNLRGLRDRAVLSVGYDTLARGGQLVLLRVEDVTPLADGGARVRMPREKQDAEGQRGVGFLSAQAYADLREWLEAAGLTSGLIFRRVQWRIRKGGVPAGAAGLKHDGLRNLIRLAATRAGVAPEEAAALTPHSMRVGAVQDLAISGHSLMQIMRAGRWRQVQGVLTYARNTPVNLWGLSDGDGYPVAARQQTWIRAGRTVRSRAEEAAGAGEQDLAE